MFDKTFIISIPINLVTHSAADGHDDDLLSPKLWYPDCRLCFEDIITTFWKSILQQWDVVRLPPPPPPTPPYSTQTDSGRTGPAPDSWGQAGPVLRETAGHTERTWGRWGHEDVRRWGRKECPRVSVWGLLSPPLLAAEVAALWWPPPATNTHCILCPQTHGHTHTSTSYNCSQLPEKLSRLYL